MKVRRGQVSQSLNQALQFPLLLRGPLQLEQHVLHQKAICHQPAIILLLRLGPCVASERDQFCFIYILCNQSRLTAFSPRSGNNQKTESSEYSQQAVCERDFTTHGNSFLGGETLRITTFCIQKTEPITHAIALRVGKEYTPRKYLPKAKLR